MTRPLRTVTAAALALLLCAACATKRIYGVTIETVADAKTKSDVIRGLGKRVTARVVFQRSALDEGTRQAYEELLRTLRAGGTKIMGLPVDAQAFASYKDAASYADRVEKIVSAFGAWVDIWEIGNEVNSQLVSGKGRKETVMAMVAAGQQVVAGHEHAQPVAVTFYIACDETLEGTAITAEAMLRYAKELVAKYPALADVDYAFISYYEHNCPSPPYAEPDWASVFPRLAGQFSRASVGFGENGVKTGTDPQCQKRPAAMHKFYGMDFGPRYVGGNFWWYFERDLLYEEERCRTTLRKALREAMKQHRD